MFGWGKKLTKEEEREKQITTLKHSFPSIRRPNNDDNLFELKFVVDKQYSSLRIIIPNDFPATRPVLQVQGPVTHPWLDQFKQVNGSHKLMNWNPAKSSVAEVVEEALQALMNGKNAATSGPALDSYGRPIQSNPQPTNPTPAPQPQVQQPTPQPQPQAQPQQTYAQQIPTAQPTASSIPQSAIPVASAYPNVTPLYPNPYAPAAANPVPTQSSAYNGVPASYPVHNQPISPSAATNNPYGSYPMVPSLAPSAVNSYPQVSPGATAQPAFSFSAVGAAPVPPSQPAAMAYNAPAAIPGVYPGASNIVNNYSVNGAGITNYGMRNSNSDPNLAYLSKPPALDNVDNSNKNISNKSSSAGNSLKAQNIITETVLEDDGRSPIPIPDIPLQFPELEKLTDIQLNRLLTDEVALLAQANNVDSVGTTSSLRDQLRIANHERATKNVQMSEEIMALQREAIEVQNKLKAAKKEYQDIHDRVSSKHGFNGTQVITELNKKKDQLDQESEEIGRKLVAGELELPNFMAEYLEKRIKYHSMQDRIQLATRPQYNGGGILPLR